MSIKHERQGSKGVMEWIQKLPQEGQ